MRLARYSSVAPAGVITVVLCLASACSNTQSTDPQKTSTAPINGFAPISTNDVSDDSLVTPPPPDLYVSAAASRLEFSWPAPPEQSTTRLIRSNLVTREYTPLFSTTGNLVTEYTLALAAHRTDWQNTKFFLETCHAEQCLVSSGQRIDPLVSSLHSTILRESAQDDQRHGQALALSTDGNTLVTGGHGYALVQFRVAEHWWDSTTLVADTQTTDTRFAHSVAISGEGNTIAVGAPGEQNQTSLKNGGVVYIHERLGEGWANTAKLDSSEPELRHFGTQVVLSDDSNLLLVAAPQATINHVADAGAVLVYQRISSQWKLTQQLQSHDPSSSALFGYAMSLADTGDRLFVSELAERGQVHEYQLQNGQFVPVTTLTNTLPALTQLAENVVSDSQGNTLAITRRRTDGSGRAVNPSLEVLLYLRAKNDAWQLEQRMVLSDVTSFESSLSLALSADASTLSIGVINPDSTNNSVTSYTSDRPWVAGGFTWARNQPLYSPGSGHDEFARALALSANGTTLIVAAPGTKKDRFSSSGEVYAW